MISSQEADEVRFLNMLGKLAEIRQVANVRSMFDQSGVTAGEYYIGQSTVLGQVAWKIIGKIML